MLIAKSNPKGVDKPITLLQARLYRRLCKKWGFDTTSDKYRSYGRAYKNQGKDGYVPEVYIGANEYREVFYDDKFPVISFFGVADERQIGLGNEVEVFLVFELNIDQVKPGIIHRGDEEIHVDVLEVLNVPSFGFTVTGLETGIDNVYREFNLYKQHSGQKSNTQGIKYRDMHPLHCFRVNMNLSYKNINC